MSDIMEEISLPMVGIGIILGIVFQQVFSRILHYWDEQMEYQKEIWEARLEYEKNRGKYE